mmetsp:Transcript_7560/g.9428  ORF Transcript_7560/g.9428 Transcript_7560/m.9428 type:complete len:316 (+) Transcript_7560:55-1002(+)
MLQYFDQAWNFFAITWLFLYLTLSWLYIKGRLYKAFFYGTKDADIGVLTRRTSGEKKKAGELQNKSKCIKTLGHGFLINFAITVILTLVFIYIAASSVNEGAEADSFDPFTILEVPPGSDLQVIRKAYKKLYIKWHPEKILHYNLASEKKAEKKSMMIAKAYYALTDPVAKENFEKFGDPDGKKSFAWLLDSDNRNLIIMSYLIIIVGAIPFHAWKFYSNSSKFGEKDIMRNAYESCHHSLNDSKSLMKSNNIVSQNQRQPDTKNDSGHVDEYQKFSISRSNQSNIKTQIPSKAVPENFSTVYDDWIILPEQKLK